MTGPARLARIELRKVRTVRATGGLLLTAAGLTALIASLDAARAGGKFLDSLSTTTGFGFVLTITGFALLMALVFGATVASGEFRHGTATVTYLGCPSRVRVLGAKLTAGAAVGLLFGLVGAVVTTAVDLIFVAAHGYAVPLSAATIVRDDAGAMLGAALLAAVGVALGSLIRSQLAVVVGVFAWSLVIESILGGLFDVAGPYLPFTAATTIAGAKPGGGGDIGFGGTPSTSPLPVLAAFVLVAAVAALITAVAARTTLRRDIT